MFRLEKHVHPYQEVNFISRPSGYLVWRGGTGGNVEILHLRTYQQRKGHGRELLVEMLTRLRASPPYKTIYGFTLPVNEAGHLFYQAMGFVLSPVIGVYAAGSAKVFSADYDQLCQRHGIK